MTIKQRANSTKAVNGAVMPRANALPALRRNTAPSPRNLSVPIDRLAFSMDAGLAFGGFRDYYLQLGYAESLTYRHYRHIHRRGGIGKRVVEAYPNATWSADPRLTEDTDSNTQTPFEAAIGELFERLNIWARVCRGDILANIGRYAVILIGTADGKLEQPLPSKLKEILYLQPLSEEHATVESWDTKTSSPRYGMPEFYRVALGGDPTITPGNTSNQRSTIYAKVHWSRLLHIAEGLLEDDVFGTPRLEAVWNNLDDLLKVVGGGAEAAWKRMDPGIQVDIDPEVPIEPDEQELIEEQFDEYQHGLRRMLQTRGAKVNLLSTTVAGFGPNATSILQLISGTTGIPQRILVGSERGELASTQDRDNWWERINERRRNFAAPLIRDFVNRLIERGAVPAPNSKGRPAELVAKCQRLNSRQSALFRNSTYVVPVIGKWQYMVTWPEVGPLDKSATAEIISKLAGANQANAQAGGGLIFTADEMRHHVTGLGPRPAEADVPATGSLGNPDSEDGGDAATAPGKSGGKAPAKTGKPTTAEKPAKPASKPAPAKPKAK